MIDGFDKQVWRLVYAVFAEQGRAPSFEEVADALGCGRDEVVAAMTALYRRHALVLNQEGDAVRMAHPFSAAPMAFVVTPADGFDERRWWGGCAWDSLGISACLALDVLIDTVCPRCGRHLRTEAGPDRPPEAGLTIRYPLPARQWWDDVVHTCSNIRLFCSTGHATEWTREHAPTPGQLVDAATVWRLAAGWYGDRLAPDYTPHTVEENQGLLSGVGLTGPFWQLG